MPALLVLPLLAALTAASTPFHVPSALTPFNSTAPRALFSLIRRQCDVACGTDGCIELGATCCDETLGSYCDAGYTCNADGCCPDGEVCDGPAESCLDPTETLCGVYCLPAGSECCDSDAGLYCDAGNTCVADGCDSSGGGGGDSTDPTPSPIDNADTTPTPSPTDDSTSTPTDAGSSDTTPSAGAGDDNGTDSDSGNSGNSDGSSNDNGSSDNDKNSSDNADSDGDNGSKKGNGGFPNPGNVIYPQSVLASIIYGVLFLVL